MEDLEKRARASIANMERLPEPGDFVTRASAPVVLDTHPSRVLVDLLAMLIAERNASTAAETMSTPVSECRDVRTLQIAIEQACRERDAAQQVAKDRLEGWELCREVLAAAERERDMLRTASVAFADLEAGQYFIAAPTPGDDSGHGGVRRGLYVFRKTAPGYATGAEPPRDTATRVVDGVASSFSNACRIVPVITASLSPTPRAVSGVPEVTVTPGVSDYACVFVNGRGLISNAKRVQANELAGNLRAVFAAHWPAAPREEGEEDEEPYCDACGFAGKELRTPVEICRDCYDIAAQQLALVYASELNELRSLCNAALAAGLAECATRDAEIETLKRMVRQLVEQNARISRAPASPAGEAPCERHTGCLLLRGHDGLCRRQTFARDGQASGNVPGGYASASSAGGDTTSRGADGPKSPALSPPPASLVSSEKWTKCLMPHHALRPTEVCGKDLTEWADRSWRCADGHYNSASTLRREALGRLVREVWVVWARDQDHPKPHHLLPWEELSDGDREVDRRIGETLQGIRDWRIGQRLGDVPPAAPDVDEATTSALRMWLKRARMRPPFDDVDLKDLLAIVRPLLTAARAEALEAAAKECDSFWKEAHQSEVGMARYGIGVALDCARRIRALAEQGGGK